MSPTSEPAPGAPAAAGIPAPPTSSPPLVSVVMITYNHHSCIRQAIEGVVGQKTAFPFELVIGEDCSTDGTREIVLECQRQYPHLVRVVTSERNVGARKNSRRTVVACYGKYVAFCEGDDYWHAPDKLAKQVGFLEAHPDYGMVHSHAHFCDLTTGRFKPNAFRCPRKLNDADAYLEILTRYREIVTASACVRRDLMEQVVRECPECTDPRFLMGDTQRWLELARRARVKCLHEPLVTKNSLAESATRSRDPARILRFTQNVRELYLHYLHKYECPEKVARSLKQRTAESVLYRAYLALDAAQAAAMWTELHRLPGTPSWKARLCHWGAQSASRQRLVRPGLTLIDLAKRAAVKLRLKRPGGLA
jgi:glycosyltransferase involved in cell wall biosynthesis